MDVSVISDKLTTIASTQGLRFAKFLLNRSHSFTSISALSVYDSSSDRSPSAGAFQISSMIFPVDYAAPPPVRSNHVKTLPRRLTRRRRRTQRRSLTGGGFENYEEFGFFSGGGESGGPFNGYGGSGGGRGWNFGGFGGSSWEESPSNSFSDPAFDFVYEVLSWIVLTNCLHFAFKKLVRIAPADGIVYPARDKVHVRLAPVC